jgi:photosystem II stability/assembly factor-like uncharacterized protein
MTSAKQAAWRQLPAPAVSTPIFALTANALGVWAGGFGGVAWHSLDTLESDWQARSVNLSCAPVTALLALDRLLLAGGSGGLAHSSDGGQTWEQAKLEEGVASVTALAASPAFATDHVALVATLESGILRTGDGGSTWQSSSFGLESLEVSALVWSSPEHLLAATDEGLYRSRDAGRSWRRLSMETDPDCEALACLPDGTLLAAPSAGGLLRGRVDETSWSTCAPEDWQINALIDTADGAWLVGESEQGILRSDDQGASWQAVSGQTAYVFARVDGRIYAGTIFGVCVSEDHGRSWSALPTPPIHDLHVLQSLGEQLLLAGNCSGLFAATPGQTWQSLVDEIDMPLTAATPDPDGTLWYSDASGLIRLSADGQADQHILKGATGQVSQIIFRQEGTQRHIWAASLDGMRLLHSTDNGASWQTRLLPTGILPLVALHVLAQRLLIAAYDPRQYRVHIWYSTNEGETWKQSIEAATNWPVVATCSTLPLLTVGNVMMIENPDGQWKQVTVGEGGGAIRRVLALPRDSSHLLLVLTTTGLQRSSDLGQTWQHENGEVAGETMLDITTHHGTVYLLDASGQIWEHAADW